MSAATLTPYHPRTDLMARLKRRSARVMARTLVTPRLSRGLVSLSFDDAPVSVRDTALPLMEAKGWRGTIYAALGLQDVVNHLGPHMRAEDYRAAHAAGHEIGDHTFSHLDPMQNPIDATLADIDRNQEALAQAGIPAPRTFAFPYGEVTPRLKRALGPRFELLRGIHSPRSASVDLRLAASQRLYSASMDGVMDALESAAQQSSWLILFTHDVRDTPSDYGCTPEEFATTLDRIDALGLDVLPVAEALERVR